MVIHVNVKMVSWDELVLDVSNMFLVCFHVLTVAMVAMICLIYVKNMFFTSIYKDVLLRFKLNMRWLYRFCKDIKMPSKRRRLI